MNKTLIRFVLVAGLAVTGLAHAGSAHLECTTEEMGYINLSTRQTSSNPVRNSVVYFVDIDNGVIRSYYPATNQPTVYDQARLISSTAAGTVKTMVFERVDTGRIVRATIRVDSAQNMSTGYLRVGFAGQTQANGNPGAVFSRGSCVL